ncbi:MAG: cytidylate kinase-like family protein [Clostridia bacterium]|nr:cytidylate kinase-like family protein [Clostridia bacterium]NCC42005.1 cytidylate kinase-like family protein [Clostridia bacterium]
MKHMIITIGCEYGSGGPEIGRMLADKYEIQYYDRDLVDSVAEQTGADRELVEKADTTMSKVKYKFETKFGPRYGNLVDKMVAIQFNVIQQFAKESSCVIIGRCSDYVLKDRDDCIRIFVYAPEEERIKTVMEKENLSEKDAKEKIEYFDEALHARYKYMTGTYRGDRRNRHLLIDSSVLGWEKTADYIKEFVDTKFGYKE